MFWNRLQRLEPLQRYPHLIYERLIISCPSGTAPAIVAGRTKTRKMKKCTPFMGKGICQKNKVKVLNTLVGIVV